MRGAVLLDGFADLHCPHCGQQGRVPTYVDESRDMPIFESTFHHCRALGVQAPLVQVGLSCKIEKEVRGDYVGDEMVQYDHEGLPIMAVRTTRDEGDDLIVLAPTATFDGFTI